MIVRNWTAEQMNAVHAHGGSILVSAAAGSGKTAVLVERVITMLTDAEHPVPADQLLVVTFTKAAAAEMKQRIGAALNERIAENPTDDFLLGQQLLLSKAHICTIHAFCGELLRDHFEQLDITPDFRIADDTEIELIKRRAMDDVLEYFYQEGTEDFHHLVDFFSSRTDQPLVDKIDTLYGFIRSHPFPFSWLETQEHKYHAALENGELPWRDMVFRSLLEAVDYGKSLFHSARRLMIGDQPMTDAYLPVFASDAVLLDEMQELIQKQNWDALIRLVCGYKSPALKALRKYEDTEKKGQVSLLRTELKAVLEDCQEILKHCSTTEDIQTDFKLLFPIVKTLFEVVRRYYETVEQIKRDKNVLDFSDLELLTLRLLLRQEEQRIVKTSLAEQIENQFQEILVDEYQDTNEIQDAIFRALSRDEKNLFMVGDIKQSVYRFRKAMPELFIEKMNRFVRYDGRQFPAKIRLDANFRSRREVTDAINFLFGLLMSPPLGDVDYAGETLKAAAEYPAQEGMDAEVHIIDHSEADDMEEKRLVYEARHIADEIRRMVEQGMPVTERGHIRQCRYSDFCVLMRSLKEKSHVFEEEFRKQGIPLWTDASDGYLGSEEVSLILNLLKVLDNPLQDIPLLSVLISPLFDFSPDEVAEIRLIDRSLPLYLAVRQAAEQKNPKACIFLEKTDQLRRFSAVSRLDQLIQSIYDTTGFLVFSSASPAGEQRTANLRLLLEYAVHYEQAGYRGVSGFIRYIYRTLEQGQDLTGANVMNETANVVRLMTIHRSKGLEFPVCFVADLSKGFNTLDLRGDMLLHPVQGIALKVRDHASMKRYATLPYEALRLSIEQNMFSEEVRVLYVALTRAKEKLILTMSCKDFRSEILSLLQKNGSAERPVPFLLRRLHSYADWVKIALLYSPSVYQMVGIEPPVSLLHEDFFKLRLCTPAFEQAREKLEINDHSAVDEKMLQELSEMLAYRYPYKQAVGLPSKLSVTQVAAKEHKEEFVLLARPVFLTGREFTAVERGTILHRFMQHLDLSAKGRVEQEIKRQVESGFLNEQQAATLDIEKIEGFLDSELAGSMRRAGTGLYREFKFMYELDASELYAIQDADSEKILIQGVADALLQEPDGITIIDYKTDHVENSGILQQRYRTQLELYARALTSAFELPVKRRVIYSLFLGKEIEV